MNRRYLLSIVFPLLLLGLFAAERSATYLLGTYPSSPLLWGLWLELRSLFRPLSQQVDLLTGDSIALQLCLFALAALLVVAAAASRKRVAIGFLVNHAALIAAAASVVVGGNPRIAALGYVDAGLELGIVSVHLSNLMVAIATLGAAACAYCHYAVVAEARQAHAVVSSRMKGLQRDL